MWLGQKVEHYQLLDSTQTLAMKRVEALSDQGLVIIADQQTAGRGSHLRSWYSNNDQGIWLSFILRPDLTSLQASQLTLLTAVVLRDVITRITNLKPAIKWPNDLLIGEKKVAGILTEAKSTYKKIDYAVVGIGLNVNQTKTQLNDQIKQTATSLKIESNRSYSKKLIIQELLNQFETDYEHYMTDGFNQIKERWLQSAFRLNSRIVYSVNGQTKEGIFIDIDDDAQLIVKDERNKIDKLASAEIEWF